VTFPHTSAEARLVDFGKYLKTAFLNRWNLLAFVSSLSFGVISGAADVVIPLVLAGEMAYVGLLSAHPRFQKAIDAQEAKQNRVQGSLQSQQALINITRNLPKSLLERFEALRTQCIELRQIALELKNPGTPASDLPLEDFQLAGLDRLLWIHLRLLYTQFALGRFLQKTKEEEITRDIQRLETQLKDLPKGGDVGRSQRVQKALEDNLETSRTRLANLSKARDNYELVRLEIDRLENKIRSLSEMAVNRQEPEFISGQVDQVASSMLDTERTMNELKFVTGFDGLEDETPELVRAKIPQVG
jgi:DNA repair exonuclease SbcCD ATPase subunit